MDPAVLSTLVMTAIAAGVQLVGTVIYHRFFGAGSVPTVPAIPLPQTPGTPAAPAFGQGLLQFIEQGLQAVDGIVLRQHLQ